MFFVFTLRRRSDEEDGDQEGVNQDRDGELPCPQGPQQVQHQVPGVVAQNKQVPGVPQAARPRGRILPETEEVVEEDKEEEGQHGDVQDEGD